jgi:ParB-like chromosome segregation protein Spo0J
MKIETVKISSLTSDPRNARKHSTRNIDAIKSSLKRFGQQKPIVVDAAGVVRAGNGTLAAAEALGWNEIQVVRTELNEAEAVAFGVADNKTAELGEWDPDVLLALNVDLEALGFSEGETAEICELAGEAKSPAASKADPRSENLKGTRPTIRIVMAFDDLKEFEDAIQRTGKLNRSEAIMEICRSYGNSKGQLDVPPQVDAAQQSAGSAEPAGGRARNSRRKR